MATVLRRKRKRCFHARASAVSTLPTALCFGLRTKKFFVSICDFPFQEGANACSRRKFFNLAWQANVPNCIVCHFDCFCFRQQRQSSWLAKNSCCVVYGSAKYFYLARQVSLANCFVCHFRLRCFRHIGNAVWLAKNRCFIDKY